MPESTDPKRIGRYDIERVLGEGAMGVVYEGTDTRLHRKVAVKTILKSALDSDSSREYSMRFAREAQAVARLNHPNIVQVFDFAEEGDVAYIVMELVRGRELKTFFDAKERFELKEIVHIMAELCEALHFAHEAGIVHRDIKPANVMIDSQGRVKLTDFGVARIIDPERTLSDKTQAGTVVGTPSYMSPEQVQGQSIDRRSDIFSAGVILYEFLCGAKPFAAQGAWAIAKRILTDEPSPPSNDAALSPLFDGVVAKALAKSADARYQTAQQLGYVLQRAFEGEADSGGAETTLKMRAMPAPAAGPAGDPTVMRTVPAAGSSRLKATELEFWRSIKDGNDPADFDLYVEQFPNGIYAALARRKSAKLRGLSSGAQGEERREIEEAARREAEARGKLAEEKAAMEAMLARREAEFQQREASLSLREAQRPKKAALVPVLTVLAAVAAGVGLWQYLKPDPASDRVQELQRLLDESKQRETDLAQSRQREEELAKELALVRQREEAARKTGDLQRQRELAEQLRQREADARKQADLTRQREQEAKAAEQRRAVAVKKADPVKPAVAALAPAALPPPAPSAPALSPSAPPSPAAADAPASVEAMLQKAVALEGEGRNREARRLLEQAVREGKGQAAGESAKRLGDMLSRGVPGVSRDYGEALRYYEIARLHGVDFKKQGPR